MSNYVRAVRFVSLAGALGLLAFSTGCQNSKKVSEAQSPPPSSISAPVRVEEQPPPPPATVNVVPAEEYAFLQSRQAPASQPLPTVTPTQPAPPPAVDESKPEYYVMQKGDTLYGVARKYNIPPKQLIAANNFPNPDRLTVGTKVKLP